MGGGQRAAHMCLVCGQAFTSRSQLFKHLERECSLRCGSGDGATVARPNDDGMVQAAATRGADIKERPKSSGKASRVISDAAVTLVVPVCSDYGLRRTLCDCNRFHTLPLPMGAARSIDIPQSMTFGVVSSPQLCVYVSVCIGCAARSDVGLTQV